MTTETTSATPELLKLGSVDIVDTFAEAFPITGTRLIITAISAEWARIAATVLCGNATSVIACDVEAAIERDIPADDTPDGRPGISVLVFAFSRDSLGKAVANRVGQCVLTCPTTALFNGITDSPKDKLISVGGQLRFFGDTFQQSKRLGSRRFWRVPVMDGEFLCEDKFGTVKGVAGGNLLIGGLTQSSALRAAMNAVAAIRQIPDTILPFPGGIVRSGSKLGASYKALKASTNDAYCPTLKGVTTLEIPDNVSAVYEIVIDGLSLEAVRAATRAGLHAAAASPDVVHITSGNYGGKLGPHHIYLRDLL